MNLSRLFIGALRIFLVMAQTASTNPPLDWTSAQVSSRAPVSLSGLALGALARVTLSTTSDIQNRPCRDTIILEPYCGVEHVNVGG